MKQPSRIRQYSDNEIIAFAKESNSISDMARKMGYRNYSGRSWTLITQRLASLGIDKNSFSRNDNQRRLSDDEIFCENSLVSQNALRKRVKKQGFLPYRCAICGMEPLWHGKSLTLTLDHIDGRNHNNVKANLRWICPNCNSQLATYKGKNIVKSTDINKHNTKLCKLCGAPISKRAERCRNCASKYRQDMSITAKIEWPNDKELEKMVSSSPMVRVARQLGVSDQAVRKHCDRRGIPYPRPRNRRIFQE